MEYPKVMVFSIDCWNKKSGSDTFTNLLSGYDKKKLANVYFKSGIPDNDICDKYFYISENNVIKSIGNKKICTGQAISTIDLEDIDGMSYEEQTEKRRYSFFSKHRLWIFLLARELLWVVGKWNSDKLDEFIRNFKPDIIFFPIESYIYFDRVVKYALEKTNAKSIGIMWDDNFTYKGHPYNLGFRIHRWWLRKYVKNLTGLSSKIFVISPKMKKEFDEEYNVSSELLTKGAQFKKKLQPLMSDISVPIKIVYTGKLNLGRLSSIQLLASILDEINCHEIRYEFYIYSGTDLSIKELESLKKKGVHFMGSVTQDKIAEIQTNADILLFAEAIAGNHKYDARLSFSTKIVDYLAAGKCILAIGPQNIAPIEYLVDNNCALVASNREMLFDILNNQLTPALVKEFAVKAYNIALENHDIARIQKKLYETFLGGSNY